MITITLITGTVKQFRFPNSVQEKKFRDAWYVMQDIPACAGRKFKIVTTAGETEYIAVSSIKNCIIDQQEKVKA